MKSSFSVRGRGWRRLLATQAHAASGVKVWLGNHPKRSGVTNDRASQCQQRTKANGLRFISVLLRVVLKGFVMKTVHECVCVCVCVVGIFLKVARAVLLVTV